jgi:hypothetical protein
VVDSVHCEASCFNKYGTYIPGRSDTAIIKIENGCRAGVKGMAQWILTCQHYRIYLTRVLCRTDTLRLCPSHCSTWAVVPRTRTFSSCICGLVYPILLPPSGERSWNVQGFTANN